MAILRLLQIRKFLLLSTVHCGLSLARNATSITVGEDSLHFNSFIQSLPSREFICSIPNSSPSWGRSESC